MKQLMSNIKEKGFTKKELLFILICSFFWIYRVTIHADVYDEIINLNIGYRLANGALPFTEVKEAFQTGDFFLALVLFPYIKLIGTGGIVLYSRFVYLLLLLGLSAFCFRTLKKITEYKMAFYISFCCLFFQLHGMYYLWYDTVAAIFLFIGLLCIFNFLLSDMKKNGLLVIGGFAHGIMGLSYPVSSVLAIGIAVILFFYLYRNMENKKKVVRHSILYCLGGIIIILLFVAYITTTVGLKDTIIAVQKLLSIRTISTTSVSGEPILVSMVKCYLTINKPALIPTILLIILSIKSVKNRNLIKYVCVGIILTALFNLIFIQEKYRGLNNYFAYVSLWGPYLFCINRKKNKALIVGAMFLWIPSIATALIIAVSQVPIDIGPNKSWEMFLPAGIYVIFLIVTSLSNEKVRNKQLNSYVLSLIVISLICNNYSYIYLNQRFINWGDSRVKSGIYRGIKVSENMQYVVTLQEDVRFVAQTNNTVAASGNLRHIYLMSSMKPHTLYTSTFSWEHYFQYCNAENSYADVMFITEKDELDKKATDFLHKNYEFSHFVTAFYPDDTRVYYLKKQKS